jgi:hypothetical protein
MHYICICVFSRAGERRPRVAGPNLVGSPFGNTSVLFTRINGLWSTFDQHRSHDRRLEEDYVLLITARTDTLSTIYAVPFGTVLTDVCPSHVTCECPERRRIMSSLS